MSRFIIFFLCLVAGIFLLLFFVYPDFFAALRYRFFPPVADVIVTDNLLRDGGEYWEIIENNGEQIGFQQTIIRENHFEQHTRLVLLREGKRFDVAMSTFSESDADGLFVSGKSITKTGLNPIEINSKKENNQITISNGKTNYSLPANNTTAPDAIIKSLLKKPMQPKEERTIQHFDTSQSQIIETNLLGYSIDISNSHKGKKVMTVVWESTIGKKPFLKGWYCVDRGGNIILTTTQHSERQITAKRTTQRAATAFLTTGKFNEYTEFQKVILHKPVNSPRTTSPITFTIRRKLADQNFSGLSEFFNDSAFQFVHNDGGRETQVRVWSSIGIDPSEYGNKDYEFPVDGNNNSPDFSEYLSSCNLIDLDDPQLSKFLLQVNTDKISDWEIAIMLEKLVHQKVRFGEFDIGFGSSSDVLRSGVGDCTEQAVLLAALCRKKRIPCRVILGLVYVNQQNKNGESSGDKMVFHLWNEVYVAGVWRPLDAAFGLGGADAARIKLADDSLQNDSIARLCRTILATIGQLEIISID
ncbi:MAG: transglutaminase family protein [Planctomycetaceae bacterium]|jgi:transglutaminase-like putative cysteine protease|nr:transglutaminase family protein [Planctomycetaceae bacterium]